MKTKQQNKRSQKPRLDVPRTPWIGIKAGWEKERKLLSEIFVQLPTDQMKRHAYVLGSTGSGKSVLLVHLMAQDILLRHSFAVLDQRGDLVNAVLELLAAKEKEAGVSLLDLREKKRPLGFNPLVGRGEPYFRALSVLDAIAAEADSWGVQLAETLRNALLILAVNRKSLLHLEPLFYDPRFRRQVLNATREDRLRSFWERFDALSQDRQAALATPVLNKVSILLSTEPLRRMFGHPEPVDLTEVVNRPGNILLVSLAIDELHSAGKVVGALLLASLCREVFSRVNTSESQRNPIRLYVDEFENFGTKEFETILAEGRRFSFSCVLAHQTLAQLSSRVRSIIFGNVGTIIAFRTSREDALVLSKHITGDPKALNLSELPTGTAYVWKQGSSPVLTEINMPLVQDVGRLSPNASTYSRRLLPEALDCCDYELFATATKRSAPHAKSVEEWL